MAVRDTATPAGGASAFGSPGSGLASYIGKKITVKFVGTEASGGNTNFFEDSNALNVH